MAEVRQQRSVKRVRQACVNCRRKKTRCPGERPGCSFCLRLHQNCKYDDDEPPTLSPAGQFSNSADMGELAARILQIESKLNDMSRSMQTSIVENPPPLQLQDYSQVFQTQPLPPSPPVDTVVPQNPAAGNSTDSEFATCIEGLPQGTLDQIIDDYFRYSHNQPYSFFHEPTFRAKVADGTLPDFVLEAVIVSAVRFSQDPYFDDEKEHPFESKRKVTTDTFARKAWKFLSSKYVDGEEECTVFVVQAVTLLAIYEFVERKQRSAWVKIGIAAKFAQDLCLMYEPDSSMPFSSQEEYRRAFWSVYLLDKLMTCGRARPPVFTDANITVQLPCTENSFEMSHWEQCEILEAYMSDKILQSPPPSTLARVIITSALLSRCSQYVIQAQRDSNAPPPWDVKSEYASINSSLLYWESHNDLQQTVANVVNSGASNGLPNLESVESMIVSRALHHLCYCLLNHYFLLRQRLLLSSIVLPGSFLMNSLQNGLYHAQQLNNTLECALNEGHMAVSSFLSYACLISATIHAVYRHSSIASISEQANKDLNFNLSFLQRQARYWPNSLNILNQLKEFCRHSQAYTDLIKVSSDVINVTVVDANRLYALTDYTTLSATREKAASWPLNSNSNVIPNRTVDVSDGFVFIDTLPPGMDCNNNMDLTLLSSMDWQ